MVKVMRTLAHKFYILLPLLILALLLVFLPVLTSCSSDADAKSGQPTLHQVIESVNARMGALEGYVASMATNQANQVVTDKDIKTELATIRSELASIKKQLQAIDGRIK